MNSRATRQCKVAPYYYAVYWLPLASLAFLLARKCNLLAGIKVMHNDIRGNANLEKKDYVMVTTTFFLPIQKL